MEKSDRHALSQVTKVNITRAKSCWQYVTLIGHDENVVFLPKAHYSRPIRRKTSDKSQRKDISHSP